MITENLDLNEKSQVIEIGSNDGYLLQYFCPERYSGSRCRTRSQCCRRSLKKGIPTIIKFFGRETAEELVKQNKQADLLIGNNILAQVPDLNGFVEGLKKLLKNQGVITIEFHHLMKLIK